MAFQPGSYLLPPPAIVSTLGRLGNGLEFITIAPSLSSTAWTVAKRVVYMPVYLDQSMTAYKLGWINGTAVSGNFDVGIYASAAGAPTTLLVNSGSTAQSGTSALQTFDITDTLLAGPATYFLAMTFDNTTATVFSSVPASGGGRAFNNMEETTGSFGLPSTATPAAMSGTLLTIPMGFSNRVVW